MRKMLLLLAFIFGVVSGIWWLINTFGALDVGVFIGISLSLWFIFTLAFEVYKHDSKY